MAALSANVVAKEIVTDGLISFWSLDRSSIDGNTVKDLWGTNHGIMEGEPEIVEGKINESLLFNGLDNLVKIDHSESLNLKEAITIEFWFLLDGNSANNNFPRAFSKGQSGATDGAYGIWINDTLTTDIGFRCVTLSPNDIRTQALPNYDDDEWHHVVVTYDGQRGKLYLDGENHVDISVIGDISQTDDRLHIGDGGNNRHFSGAVDEARIYNRALDEGEVVQNFEAKSNDLAVEAVGKLAITWGGIKSKY
jgi:hypothetical protein